MPAYMVADVQWHDEVARAKYREGHTELLAKYGGEILAGSDAAEIIEGTWKPRLLVIFRFPSKKDFHAWYTSAEYAPRLALRLQHADANVTLIGDSE
jgi:uncharacterized protein (DUF1330 family)